MNTYTYKAKDGTLITGIPDNITTDDPRLFEQYKQMKATGQNSAPFGLGSAQGPTAMIDPAPDPSDPTPYMSASSVRPPPRNDRGQVAGDGPNSFLQDLGQGAVATGRGLASGLAGTVGIVSDPITALLNVVLPDEYKGMPVREGIQALLTRLGVDEAETEAAKIVQAAATGLGDSIGPIGAGRVLARGASLAPSVMKNVGTALASGPVQQAMGDIGASAAGEIAAQEGAGPGVQLLASGAGSLLGSTAGNVANLRKAGVSPMQGIVDDAAQFRTQPMTSDVFPPQTFAGKTWQSLAEKIPVLGTGPVRAAQQTNRIQDVRDLLKRFGADDAAAASDDVMQDLISKRQTNFNRWENMKEEALKAVETSKPGATVPMTKTMQSIDDSINYLKSLNNPDLEPAMQRLANAKQSFQNQSPVNVLKNKQILGDIFDAPEMGALKRTASSELKKTYEAVKDDLTDFIGDAGGTQAKNKWMIANKEESKLFKELDLDILKNTLEKGVDRPEVVRNMLFNRDKSVIESLDRNLTAKGRAAAQTAIMQEVGRRIGEDASPEKFLTEMRKLRSSGDPVGVFFKGDDLKVVEGLTRVLKATGRASQAAANPQTGVQAVIPLSLIGMGGGSVALEKYFGQGLPGLLGSVALVGAAGGGARLYESPAVRDILMKLPTVAANSVEEAALFKRLLEVSQSFADRQSKTSAPRRREEERANER